MRYVEARIEDYTREEAYRIYVARSLQLAPQGQWLVKPYSEIMQSVKEEPKEEKTGDDIVADIMSRAGLKFG